MSDDLEGVGEVQRLIASQSVYYELRAPDYAEVTKNWGLLDSSEARRLIDEFAPASSR